MRPWADQRAREQWHDDILYVNRIIELRSGVECVVGGTVCKEMPLIPNLLKEYTAERVVVGIKWNNEITYTSEKDTITLEDDTSRVRLALPASIPVSSLVTGTVLCARGTLSEEGNEFVVTDFCVPGIPIQPDIPLTINGDCYVALVSGLSIGAPNNSLFPQLFCDFIAGILGTPEDQQLSSSIVHIIEAGNSIYSPPDSLISGTLLEKESHMASQIDIFSEADAFFCQLASMIPVEMMPGETDPSSLTLPQQPMKPFLFPLSSQMSTFHLVTNPHECEIAGRIFIGTSGQNIENMRRLCKEEGITLMQKTLEWRHLAPTAPDTLGCFPFVEDDPFILDQCPHIYFAGNQHEFATNTINGESGQRVVTVLVPDFATTQTIALVNLRTLAVTPFYFRL
ncbi:DNA polymerase delta subunit 2 [Pelomyxa schiedti]|nr:DNA polymerase delta subunit 2 [Pelomyxa schiedti]